MRKINDSKLYFYFIMITLMIGILLGLIFSYSAFFVEPGIKELLSNEENIDESYKNAFSKLKNPQIFARYENFDRAAARIKTIIQVYDEKIKNNTPFNINDKRYLEILLERREMGALLTRNTMIFFFCLSVLGLIFYVYELRQNK
ncbi:MAG: hypothetical protein JXN64_00635 [Spirochaetes bacterium]|nr:hypothetical protein [Spirochaetota bacterium]